MCTKLNVQHENCIMLFYVSAGKSQSCLFSSTNLWLAVEGQAGKLFMFDPAAFGSDEYLIRQERTVWEVEAAVVPH